MRRASRTDSLLSSGTPSVRAPPRDRPGYSHALPVGYHELRPVAGCVVVRVPTRSACKSHGHQPTDMTRMGCDRGGAGRLQTWAQ